MRDGIAKVDAMLARRKRGPQRVAQAALVAIDPRTGEILAMIGGRSYNQSQFNRAVRARRQIGSTFKPFVYLAAFEHTADEGGADLTPASMVWDEPTTWTFDNQEWAPHNYDEDYDGEITLRRALAMSRNIATIKVAEQTGFDRVAALWKKTGSARRQLKAYPSIALGVFELTPLEVAEAYTLFPNGGDDAQAARDHEHHERRAARSPAEAGGRRERWPSPTTAFLVTHMMRSVLNEGTGAAARAAGFALDAAGKSGTTNDLSDAWFVGFTPELLTVVWVGLRRQPTARPERRPGGAADLDRIHDQGARRPGQHRRSRRPTASASWRSTATPARSPRPNCPRVTNEAFLAGTEPTEACALHKF